MKVLHNHTPGGARLHKSSLQGEPAVHSLFHSATGDTGTLRGHWNGSGDLDGKKRGERQTREGRGEEKAEKEKEANPSHHGQTKKAVSSFRHMTKQQRTKRQ